MSSTAATQESMAAKPAATSTRDRDPPIGGDNDVEGDNGSWSEHEYPPLKLNYDAITHIASYYLPGGHGACTKISRLARGVYHEVEVLEFEDGWTCIGRFVRDKQSLGLTESEIATMKYVKKCTSIPVPEVYFANHNPDHVVGAPFMLLERLPGTILVEFWDDLSFEHKRHVVSQVADVLHQLAGLKFDVIGSLTASGIGPSRERGAGQWHDDGLGPYDTLEDYMYGLMDVSPSMTCCDECPIQCANTRAEVSKFFEKQKDLSAVCGPPFVLTHGDMGAQNMLFETTEDGQPPRLTGIIDWDCAQTIPLYYLYEYPHFIQDHHSIPEDHAENKILRQHLVHELANKHPEGSVERRCAREAFYKKNYFLNGYMRAYPEAWDEHTSQAAEVKYFLQEYLEGAGSPYRGMVLWEPDTDSENEREDDDSDLEDMEASEDSEDTDDETDHVSSDSGDEARNVASAEDSPREDLGE